MSVVLVRGSMISTAPAPSGAAYNLPTLSAYVMPTHLYPPDPRPARVMMSVVLVRGSTISTAAA